MGRGSTCHRGAEGAWPHKAKAGRAKPAAKLAAKAKAKSKAQVAKVQKTKVKKKPAAASASRLELGGLGVGRSESSIGRPPTLGVLPRTQITMGSCFAGFATDHWAATTSPLLKDFWLSTSWWCEKDAGAQKFLRGNLSGVRGFEDVSKPEFILEAPRVDVLSGGFPCQPFSQAGKNLSTRDARGILVLYLLQFIERTLPYIVILENVKGLMTRHAQTFHELLELCASIKESSGHQAYSVFHKLLDSQFYGVPQHRERVYIVLIRRMGRDPVFRWPEPSESPPPVSSFMDSSRRRLKSLADFPLKDLAGPRRDRMQQAMQQVLDRAAANGKRPASYTPIVDVGGSRVNIGWNACPTITRSRGGSRDYWSLAHGCRLSVTELLRLQGLPTTVHQCVGETTVGHLIGKLFHLARL